MTEVRYRNQQIERHKGDEKVKEHPILFSTDMVKAILDGRKTMTRRVIKPQPMGSPYRFDGTTDSIRGGKIIGDAGYCDGGYSHHKYIKCPYGQAGSELWVRETWKEALTEYHYKGKGHGSPTDPCVGYKATMTYKCGEPIPDYPIKWRPSIHMPHWASRITLEITEVRVERLQEIFKSPDDIIAEGFGWHGSSADFYDLKSFPTYWDSLNAKWKRVYNREKKIYEFWQFPWDDTSAKPIPKTTKHPERYHSVPNPWVWVISFGKVE